MNYIVDPDVFEASLCNQTCMLVLARLASEGTEHRFYRDREETVVREYRVFYDAHYDQNPEHPAVGLLQRILFEDADEDLKVSSNYDEYMDKLSELRCVTPVEPHLIGMLSRARDLGLILLLSGLNSGPTRYRGMHEDDKFRLVGKMFPWLEAAFASTARVELPALRYKDDPSHPKAKEFEGKVALWLQSPDPQLKCYTPPGKKQVGGEQIDVYGHRQTAIGVQVVVGECKLRRAGNESKLITREDLQQLRRKAIAARDYERQQRRVPGDSDIRVQALLVSNAFDLDDDARRLAIQEHEMELRFVSVKLSRGWETEDEWTIVEAHGHDYFQDWQVNDSPQNAGIMSDR